MIDSRYRSGKPLIVTTNHTPDMLENPQDTAHARIYDRLIEMCSPVCFTAKEFPKGSRKSQAGQAERTAEMKGVAYDR